MSTRIKIQAISRAAFKHDGSNPSPGDIKPLHDCDILSMKRARADDLPVLRDDGRSGILDDEPRLR